MLKDHLFWMVINVSSGNYFLLMDYGSGINLGKLHAPPFLNFTTSLGDGSWVLMDCYGL